MATPGANGFFLPGQPDSAHAAFPDPPKQMIAANDKAHVRLRGADGSNSQRFEVVNVCLASSVGI
jgi:hypothetical protein